MSRDDVTSIQYRSRLHIRTNQKRGTSRLRFTSLHPDQLEIIVPALEKAREESGTEFYSVALTNICQHYLST